MDEKRTDSDRPPLGIEVDHDQGLILVVDGRSEIVALTYAEAAALAELLAGTLRVVGWPS